MRIEDSEDWLLMQEAYDLFAPYIAQRDQSEQHEGKKPEKRRYRRKNKLVHIVIPIDNFDPFLDSDDLP